MLLVPADAANRINDVTNHTPINSVEAINENVHDVMEDEKLSDEFKWKQISQLLTKLFKKSEEQRQPIKIPIIEEISAANINENVSQNKISYDFSAQIANSVPKLLKSKALGLYAFVEKLPGFTVDSIGQVSINNVLIARSNIVRNRKSSQAVVGLKYFANFLSTANVPLEFVGNEEVRKLITSQAASIASSNEKKKGKYSLKSEKEYDWYTYPS